METLKEADEARVGGLGCRRHAALRREPRRSEGGVHEPARLHSCSKFTTPGSYYSNISNYSTLYHRYNTHMYMYMCVRVRVYLYVHIYMCVYLRVRVSF